MRTVEPDNWSKQNLYNAMLVMRNLLDRLEHSAKNDTWKLTGAITRIEYRTMLLGFRSMEIHHKEAS
jgi:hypothetical protein